MPGNNKCWPCGTGPPCAIFTCRAPRRDRPCWVAMGPNTGTHPRARRGRGHHTSPGCPGAGAGFAFCTTGGRDLITIAALQGLHSDSDANATALRCVTSIRNGTGRRGGIRIPGYLSFPVKNTFAFEIPNSNAESRIRPLRMRHAHYGMDPDGRGLPPIRIRTSSTSTAAFRRTRASVAMEGPRAAPTPPISPGPQPRAAAPLPRHPAPAGDMQPRRGWWGKAHAPVAAPEWGRDAPRPAPAGAPWRYHPAGVCAHAVRRRLRGPSPYPRAHPALHPRRAARAVLAPPAGVPEPRRPAAGGTSITRGRLRALAIQHTGTP